MQTPKKDDLLPVSRAYLGTNLQTIIEPNRFFRSAHVRLIRGREIYQQKAAAMNEIPLCVDFGRNADPDRHAGESVLVAVTEDGRLFFDIHGGLLRGRAHLKHELAGAGDFKYCEVAKNQNVLNI